MEAEFTATLYNRLMNQMQLKDAAGYYTSLREQGAYVHHPDWNSVSDITTALASSSGGFSRSCLVCSVDECGTTTGRNVETITVVFVLSYELFYFFLTNFFCTKDQNWITITRTPRHAAFVDGLSEDVCVFLLNFF